MHIYLKKSFLATEKMSRGSLAMQITKIFFSSFVMCFLLDMVWLGFIAKNLYFTTIGSLLRRSGDTLAPNWPAAVLVYIFIAGGIVLFALPKANGNYLAALLWGGLFGAVTYGVYDFTNFSTLSAWPFKITIIDFLWGTVLCALVTVFANYLQQLTA
jgi:uncharacterized membrane protein